jgi:DNA-directed RNA polymerase subunit RPC12/RpoP
MMKKFACPHCKKATISLWQKVRISPFADIRCEACGSKLTTRYSWVFLAGSPLIVGYPLLSILNVVTSERGTWLLLAGTSILSILLATFVMPIFAANDSSEEQHT